jgi:hypothetical protein
MLGPDYRKSFRPISRQKDKDKEDDVTLRHSQVEVG